MSPTSDLLYLPLNNNNQFASNTFIPLGVLATCYTGVIVGAEANQFARDTWVRDLSDQGLGVGTVSSVAASFLDGTIKILPGIGSKSMRALAVDCAGDIIAGTANDGQQFELVYWNRAGDTWAIVATGVPFAWPTDVNCHGKIVGWIEEASSADSDAAPGCPFIFHEGSTVILPRPAGAKAVQQTRPDLKMNSSDTVVGTLDFEVGESSYSRAVMWRDLQVDELGTLGGSSSGANGINSAGDVVGWSTNVNGQVRACVWHDGTPRDLNDVLPASVSITLEVARAINDNGVILAVAAETRDVVLLFPDDTDN